MNNDFGVPAAIASVHDIVREGNKALSDGNDAAVRGALGSVRAMLAVLGIDPLSPPWIERESNDSDLSSVVEALVSAQLQARAQAREAKDFEAADAIRKSLTAAGIAIEDTADGARWSIAQEQ